MTFNGVNKQILSFARNANKKAYLNYKFDKRKFLSVQKRTRKKRFVWLFSTHLFITAAREEQRPERKTQQQRQKWFEKIKFVLNNLFFAPFFYLSLLYWAGCFCRFHHFSFLRQWKLALRQNCELSNSCFLSFTLLPLLRVSRFGYFSVGKRMTPHALLHIRMQNMCVLPEFAFHIFPMIWFNFKVSAESHT